MIEDHNIQIPEEDYREMDIPSYSLLSSMSKHGVDVLGGIKGNFFQLKFGSLVDDICFQPSKLVNYYQAKGVKSITGNPKIIIDSVLKDIDSVPVGQEAVVNSFIPLRSPKKKIVSENIGDYKNEIIQAARSNSIYKNYNDDKVFDTILGKKDNHHYFTDKIKSRGKVHVKPEMWELAVEAANTLKTHDFTKIYFDDNTPEIQLIYQYKFVQNINGYDVKGMLDCLVVDHDNKVIYPVDLKTGEDSAENFDEVMLLHKYYLQASLYRSAIKAIVAKDPDLDGYTVSNFEFVYLSKMNIFKPLIWVVPQTLHKAGWDGFTDRFGFKHKGLTELLAEYQYAKDNALCPYVEVDYNNDGRKFLSGLIKNEEK